MSVQITTELNWYLMYLCWFLLDISISNLCEFFLLSTVTVDNCPDGPSFYPHRGGPMWPLPTVHWNSLYRAPPDPGPPGHGTSGVPFPSPNPLVTSGGHHWGPVQICLLQDRPPWGWHLVVVETGTVRASRRYTSYWNAFSLILKFI